MNELHKKQPFYHALDAGEFKEQCMALIAEIAERGGSVIVDDGYGPAVELVRYVEIPNPAYGAFKDVKILGDIEGPMPVEWYTHPDVQSDDDWDISGPMPASWFVNPNEGKPLEPRKPDKVDVSVLYRHKFLTVDLDEFTEQLEEIITAIAATEGRAVIVFDEEKPLVEVTKCQQPPVHHGDTALSGPSEECAGTMRGQFDAT